MTDKKVDSTAAEINGFDDTASLEAGNIINAESTSQPATNELHRSFTARHIQMIGLAGSIGSGLFIGTGKALRYGNYPGLFLGWSVVCAQQWMQMQVMSEACVIFPTSGAFLDHANRFLDPAIAFSLGFCEWFAWHTTLAAEGAVFHLILTYWTEAIPTAACMTIYLVIVFGIHVLPSRVFAEVEFGTAVAKVILMIIIFITCIVMICGGGPTGTTHHAENYTDLPAFPNAFKGIAQSFLLASFSCGGNELLGITNGEAKMPRWNLPRAVNNLAARLFFFFGLTTVFISVLVPYNDSRLLGPSNIAASPFVIAMQNAGIKGLPDLVNVVMIVGLCAMGTESLYICSRMGTAMARMNFFPKQFGYIDKIGRPYVSLLFSAALSTVLTYINCSNTGGIMFTWFSSVGSTVYFIATLVVAATNWRMRAAFKAQNDNPLDLKHAYKNKAYPLGSVLLFISGCFLIASTIYISASPIGAEPSVSAFFQTCLCIPLFLVVWLGYKVIFRTKWVDPAKADLQTGRRPLTEEDIAFLDDYYRKPLSKRLLSYFVL